MAGGCSKLKKDEMSKRWNFPLQLSTKIKLNVALKADRACEPILRGTELKPGFGFRTEFFHVFYIVCSFEKHHDALKEFQEMISNLSDGKAFKKFHDQFWSWYFHFTSQSKTA